MTGTLNRVLRSDFPDAVERVMEAAEGSRRAARTSQARIRRERISSHKAMAAVRPEDHEPPEPRSGDTPIEDE
jgi:hypothetical protein